MTNYKSLINRYFGMYRITRKKIKIRFLIMENIFCISNGEIGKIQDLNFKIKFDLKGSTIGRKVSNPNPNSIFKDLDFFEKLKSIQLPKELKTDFINQIKIDSTVI